MGEKRSKQRKVKRSGEWQVVGAQTESEGREEGGRTSLMRKCQMNKGRRRGLYQREVQTPREKKHTHEWKIRFTTSLVSLPVFR